MSTNDDEFTTGTSVPVNESAAVPVDVHEDHHDSLAMMKAELGKMTPESVPEQPPSVTLDMTPATMVPAQPVLSSNTGPLPIVGDTSVLALVKAQGYFIAAQTTFLHGNNLDLMIDEQAAYMRAMALFIRSRNTSLLAGAQEKAIQALSDVLAKVGQS